MEIDKERVDEMVLALLYLTTFKDKPGGHGKVTTGIPSIASIKGATSRTRRRKQSRSC